MNFPRQSQNYRWKIAVNKTQLVRANTLLWAAMLVILATFGLAGVAHSQTTQISHGTVSAAYDLNTNTTSVSTATTQSGSVNSIVVANPTMTSTIPGAAPAAQWGLAINGTALVSGTDYKYAVGTDKKSATFTLTSPRAIANATSIKATLPGNLATTNWSITINGTPTTIVPNPSSPGKLVNATGGSGLYKNQIQWVQWGNANETQLKVDGGSKTVTMDQTVGGDTLRTTCTISGLKKEANSLGIPTPTGEAALIAYKSGQWIGDGLDDLYNIGGSGSANQMSIGLANNLDSPTTDNYGQALSFDYSCDTNLISASGQIKRVPIRGLVFADAEASGRRRSDGAKTEFIQATPTNGSNVTWRIIDRFRAQGCPTSSVATPLAGNGIELSTDGQECVNLGYASGPISVAFMEGATASHVKIQGGGRTAVALGMIMDTDFGDAPESYGSAGTLFQRQWSGGTIGSTAQAVNESTFSLATLTDTVVPRLGTKVDAEVKDLNSSMADGDDIAGDDEDALPGSKWGNSTIEIPKSTTVRANSTYSLAVPCTGTSTSYVRGWIDWNANGVFDPGEESDAQNCNGTTTVNLTFTMPANTRSDLVETFLRLRISDSQTMAATGMTTAGEIEDYRIVRTVAGLKKEVINKYGGTALPNEWQLKTDVFAADKEKNALNQPWDYWTVAGGDALKPSEEVIDSNKTYGYELQQLTCQEYSWDRGTQQWNSNGAPKTWDKTSVGSAAFTPKVSTKTECIFTNQDLPGDVSWLKVDSETKKQIGGSEWRLDYTSLDGKVTESIVFTDNGGSDTQTDEGALKLENLKRGSYKLYETKAPAGYSDADPNKLITQFTITGKDGQRSFDLGTIENALALGKFVLEKIGKNPLDPTKPASPISGAEFVFYSDNGQGMPGPEVDSMKVTKAPSGSQWTVDNLRPGDYWIVETKAPTGYNLLAQPVKVNLSLTPTGQKVTLADGSTGVVTLKDDAVTLVVEDSVQAGTLPRTGGSGLTVPIGIASILIAAGFIFARRKPARI